MFNKYFFFVTVFLLSSCGATNNSSSEDISLTGSISDELVLDDLFGEFEYISLETSKESTFGEIKKLIIYNNKYYIHDSHLKKIFVFREDGTFIHAIGQIGKGPGEYTHLEDFVIDEENNRIIILGNPSIVYVYDLDGNYIMQKQIMDLPVWNFCSYADGVICSTNHQSFSTKEEALIFLFDKDFNLKGKIGRAIPDNTLPPFISYPFFKDKKNIYYFDNINSTLYLINTTDPSKSEAINFLLSAPIPLDILSDPQKFITSQANYCFFINAFISNNIIWAWFTNQGTPCVLVRDLKNKKQILAKYNSWFPEKMINLNEYFYAPLNVEAILEGKIITDAKRITQYPIDYNSNPVILRFKSKQILK